MPADTPDMAPGPPARSGRRTPSDWRAVVGELANAWWRVTATVIVGLALTGTIFHMARLAEDRQTQAALESGVEWRAKDLDHKIDHAVDPVKAVAVFAASRGEFTDAEFHSVAGSAWELGQSIQTIVWIPRVARERREAFEDEARRSGMADYSIVDIGSDSIPVPSAARAEHFPIRMGRSFGPRMPLMGFDLSSEPTRRNAATRARDEGRPIATPVVRLLNSQPSTSGFVVYIPIFDGDGPPATIETRRERLRGYVAGVFEALPMINLAMANTPDVVGGFLVYIAGGDGTGISELGPVAMYAPDTHDARPFDPATIWAANYVSAREFETLGQKWRIVQHFPQSVFVAIQSNSPYGWLFSGLLITALTTTFVAREKWQAALAQNLVEKRTTELKATAVKMQALVDSSPLATIALDSNRLVVAWSRAARHIFGYDPAEIIGRAFPLVAAGGEAAFDKLFRTVAIAGQPVQDTPMQLRHGDGTTLDIVFAGAPLLDAGHKVIGAVLVLEDVTEKKRVEQKLVQAQKMEAVGQLTGGIAHDFNNILGLVIGNLDQLIEASDAEPDVKRLGAAALDAALRGAELVRRLMAFSRNQPLAPKLLHLGNILRGIEPMIRQTLDERIVIDIRVEEGVWTVLADQAQFENAILNIAINARDAMPDGGRLGFHCANDVVDRTVAEMNDLTAGDYVTLTVSDTGTGIPQDILTRVFEPFFTTKEVGKGSGLGLSMVYGYARQSGGTVKIYSEIGHGTDIRLYFPRARGGAVSQPSGEPAIVISTGAERILVVEDKPDVRQMAVALLRSMGYWTIAAENAAAAIGILDRGETFDLLFTDLIMPGAFGGIGLAREVRRRHPEMPIIFTTGFSDPAELRREMASLGAMLVAKPYRKSELAACVHAALVQGVRGL